MQEGQHERLEAIETEAFTDLSLTSVVMMRARTERGALGDPARRADVRAVDTRSASMILCDFCEHFFVVWRRRSMLCRELVAIVSLWSVRCVADRVCPWRLGRENE